jgi:Delta3,5-Delta2,4-dienoyl-CoA isomerase
VDLITACDVRYCSDCARFSVKEVAVGLCADVGTLQRLPKCGGSDSWVRELAYTGRTAGAAEALQFGLVSKVCSGGRQGVLEAAIYTAESIAKHSPLAVAGTRFKSKLRRVTFVDHKRAHSRSAVHTMCDCMNSKAFSKAC